MIRAGKKTTDVSELAALFGLPSWDDLDELNLDYYYESARGAVDDPDDENALMEAESAVRDELYVQWHDAVLRAAEHEFEQHGLVLVPVGKERAARTPYNYVVRPSTSWRDAANLIRETINGVGYFQFDTLKEFLDSGPYTAHAAVMHHLHWLARRWEVYGDTSPRSRYERAFK